MNDRVSNVFDYEVPHDLSIDSVLAHVKENPNNVGVLTLKPGYWGIKSGVPLIDLVEGLINSIGLTAICTRTRTLTENDVYELYKPIFTDNPDITSEHQKWIEDTRKTIMNYMTSDQVHSYLIEGKDTFNRIGLIKECIRHSIYETSGTKIIQNIVHTPEEWELDFNIRILFKNE